MSMLREWDKQDVGLCSRRWSGDLPCEVAEEDVEEVIPDVGVTP